MNYLDDEKKGFIDFKKFSAKVKRNMTNNDPFGEEIHRNIMEPNHAQIKRLNRDQKFYKGVVKDAHESVKPGSHQNLKGGSRHGCAPAWKNTFLNFQPDKTGPQFMSEAKRLVANSQTRTSYQWDDKARANGYSRGRENQIRTHNNFFNQKIENKELSLAKKEDVKLQKKGAQQLFYEHNNHLKNAYY